MEHSVPQRYRGQRASAGLLLSCLAAVLWLSLPAATASAHVPTVEPPGAGASAVSTVAAEPPDVSRAWYGYLAEGEAADEWAFTADGAATVDVSLLVPVREGTKQFRPELVISRLASGPGDFDLVVGRVRRPEQVRISFEPFSLERFYELGFAEANLRSGARYVVRVAPGAGDVKTGPYTIAFSGPERFSAGDALRSARDVPRIWFGLYGDAPVRWGRIALFAGVLALVVALLVVLARSVRAWRRRKRAVSP